MDFFLAKKVLTALVLPVTGPLLMAFVGLALLNARPALGRALAWLSFLILLGLSLPVVSDTLQRCVNDSAPLDFAQASSAQAIVILGGGVRRDAPEYGGDTLSRLTLDRVRYGALVARRTNLPVLVSGGVVYRGSAEAVLMKQSLEEEFNVKVRWAEARSRNTHENAVKSAEILLAEGVQRVILVGHSFDIPRAMAELTAAGLEVISAPTYIPHSTFESPLEILPSIGSLQSSYYAIYELLAELARKIGL